jgi:hypothetical protein
MDNRCIGLIKSLIIHNINQSVTLLHGNKDILYLVIISILHQVQSFYIFVGKLNVEEFQTFHLLHKSLNKRKD